MVLTPYLISAGQATQQQSHWDAPSSLSRSFEIGEPSLSRVDSGLSGKHLEFAEVPQLGLAPEIVKLLLSSNVFALIASMLCRDRLQYEAVPSKHLYVAFLWRGLMIDRERLEPCMAEAATGIGLTTTSSLVYSQCLCIPLPFGE